MTSLTTTLGRVTLKNPLIAGSAEHLIEVDGIRRALKAGVGAVIVKSVNESDAARDQLQRAEYMLLDEHWNPVEWGPNAPASAFVACRSGFNPTAVRSVARTNGANGPGGAAYESYAVPSVILADLDNTVQMAKQIEQAGFDFGTQHWHSVCESGQRCSFDRAGPSQRIGDRLDGTQAISLPLWVKITGQSERVPDLAAAAFAAGGDTVVMAGRSLGLIPILRRSNRCSARRSASAVSGTFL